ncbi:MAG: DUF3822 family protein [Cytophagaceae bacterium]|nr:DUF3822 family protein [Cytophagaceae bacterium]
MEPIFKITDDRFDSELIDQYDLVVEWQDSRLKIALKNKKNGIFFWFEDYFLGNYSTFDNSIIDISKIFNSHQFLKANFWNSITFLIHTPLFVKIENIFFDSHIPAIDYLKAVFPQIIESEIRAEAIEIGDSHFVFGISENIFTFLSETYQNKTINIKPKLAHLAETLTKKGFLSNSNLLILNDKWFDLIIISDGNFSIKKMPFLSNEIKRKYIELLRHGNQKTYLYGEITPFSHVYKKIKSEIDNIEIGKLPSGNRFSQYFEEMPEQRHLSLFL